MGNLLYQILTRGFGTEPLLDYAYSLNIGYNVVGIIAPTYGTTTPNTPYCPGVYVTSSGTISHPTPSTTNKYTSSRRTVWTSANTANATAGCYTNATFLCMGSNSRYGGFQIFVRFAQVTNVASTRAFIGLSSLTSFGMVSGEPSSASASFIGIGFNAADANTNWRVMWKDGTTYGSNDIGSNAARSSGNNMYDLWISCYPNDSKIYMSLYNVYTNTVALNETAYSTNIPSNTTFLGFHFVCGPAAAGASVALALHKAIIMAP